MSKIIMGFVLHDRTKSAASVQELLTTYGSDINTRIGLHGTSGAGGHNGLILLEFADGAEKESTEFEKELKEIADVDIQKMVFH